MEFLLGKIHLFHHSKNINDRFRKIIQKEFKGIYTGDFIEYTNNSPRVTQQQINDFIDLITLSSAYQMPEECLNKLKKITPPKAYSYFGTITKRWLIIHNDKNYKKKKKIDRIDISDVDNNITESSVISTNDNLYNFIEDFVKYCYDNIYEIFPDKVESKIADAILNLFIKREHLIIFNKKALYLNIRETIDTVKTSKITKVADDLYSIFRPSYTSYLETGIINFEPYIFILKNERSR